MTTLTRFFYSLAILLLTCSNLQAQGWERAYDLENLFHSTFYNLHLTQDNHHLIIGRTDAPRRTYIMKVDPTGEVVWLKKQAIVSFLVGSALCDDGGLIYSSNEGSWPTSKTTLTKTDAAGELVWAKTYEMHGNWGGDIVQTTAGDYLMTGNTIVQTSDFIDSIRLTKFNPQGEILWNKTYQGNTTHRNSQVLELSNGNICLAGHNAPFSGGDLMVIMVNENGEQIWKNTYPSSGVSNPRNMIETANGDVVLIGSGGISRIDPAGNILWNQFVPGLLSLHDIKELPNGNLVLTSTEGGDVNDVGLNLADADGNLLWSRFFVRPFTIFSRPRISLCPDGNGFLIGCAAETPEIEDNRFSYLIKTDSLGNIYSNQIQGQVRFDENENCLTDPDEQPLENWYVAAKNEGQTYFGRVDANGEYVMDVDTGFYQVHLLQSFDYWEACMDTVWQQINILDTVEVDFAVQALVDCPSLQVDVATVFLRRCAQNVYEVNYCNLGTVDAEDAYVEFTIDDHIVVDSASLMWSAVNGDTYTFDLGNVAINECDHFKVYTTLDPNCDTTMLGETRCIFAHIFPDSICQTAPNWDQSSIDLSAECIGDSIYFYIKNIGNAPMTEFLEYIVIEDNIMRHQGDFNLLPQEVKELVFPATGTTMRLETEQASGHPGFSNPNITVEGCDPDGDGEFSVGYFLQWPMDDLNPFVDIECREIIGSYDPNDKQASPRGVDDAHYILANTPIEYLIRFQNIGNDTAFNVVVLDTLSPLLDISTLQLGTSSFPYRMEVLPGRILKFSFEGIKLLAEEQNEPASHGFVQFRIGQKEDLALGTVIENSAAIFFDLNPPIITNTSFHTIGKDFIDISLDNKELYPGIELNVQPNPFQDRTQFTLQSQQAISQQYTLSIYNSMGQLVRTAQFQQASYQLERKDLSKGLYLFQVEAAGQIVANGKIVIQ